MALMQVTTSSSGAAGFKQIFPALRPVADSPYRKGFYDGTLAGCIPVIFSHQMNSATLPAVRPKGVADRTRSPRLLKDYLEIFALDVLRPFRARRSGGARRTPRHGHRLHHAGPTKSG